MAANKFNILENFDSLVKLAQDDPVGFEAYRAEMIEQLISGTFSERQMNLRRFQWRIEQETRNHKNSMGRCIKLSSMMTERLNYLAQQIDIMTGKKAGEIPTTQFVSEKKVIQLR